METAIQTGRRFEAIHPQVGFRNRLLATVWGVFPVVGTVLTWFWGNLNDRDAGYWIIMVPFDVFWMWVTIWYYRGVGNPKKNWVELRDSGIQIELFNHRPIGIPYAEIEAVELKASAGRAAWMPLARTPKGRHAVLKLAKRKWFPFWSDAARSGVFPMDVRDADALVEALQARLGNRSQ